MGEEIQPLAGTAKTKTAWFIKVGNNVFNRTMILSLRKSTPSKGKDRVLRDWILIVDPICTGSATYNKFWLTQEEAESVKAKLGIELPDGA